jgi:hypothetical protein
VHGGLWADVPERDEVVVLVDQVRRDSPRAIFPKMVSVMGFNALLLEFNGQESVSRVIGE